MGTDTRPHNNRARGTRKRHDLDDDFAFCTRRPVIAGVIILTVLLAHAPAAAFNLNGFLRSKGEGDVAPSYSRESYDEFWRGTETTSSPMLGEVETSTASLWMAYGLTDRFTLFGSLPYVETEGDGLAGFRESDPQDLSLLAACRIKTLGSNGRHQLVGAVGVRLPLSSYEPDQPVAVGDGTSDGLFRFVYLLHTGRFYLSQQLGFDLRGEDAPDGYPLYTEIGYTLGRTTVNGFFDKLVTRHGTDIGDPGFTFPSLREEYERVGAKVYVRLTQRFGISVAGFTTLEGRNTGDASGGSFGINFGF